MKISIYFLFALLFAASLNLSAQQKYSGGLGTPGDPYQIATVADLIELSKVSNIGDWHKHFKQTAHISFNSDNTLQDWNGDGSVDASDAAGFSPIGSNSTNFTGSYNGQYYTISNLFINRPATDYIGLFGYTNGSSTISNVGLLNVNITGNNRVGGLVGYNSNNSTVSNSYATGAVSGINDVGGLVGLNSHNNSTITNSYSTGAVSGINDVGGLVGLNSHNNSTITNSYSTGDVTGTNFVGGLVGSNYFVSTISNSYSTGDVTGTKYVGGLVGENNTSSTVSYSYSTGNVIGVDVVGGFVGRIYASSTVSNSYSTGNVTRSSGSSTYFGGFCGYDNSATIKIEYCYSKGKVYSSVGVIWNVDGNKNKGFLGFNGAGTYTHNFFDATASQQTSSPNATAKTTNEMRTKTTFSDAPASWDFSGDAETDWVMSSPIAFGGYPTFRWTGGYSVEPTGTPKEITSLPNLVWVAEALAVEGSFSFRWSFAYTQTANLNMWTTPSWDGNKGWTPIGTDATNFTGSYNGQYYTISNLFINRPATDYIGLFGYTNL